MRLCAQQALLQRRAHAAPPQRGEAQEVVHRAVLALLQQQLRHAQIRLHIVGLGGEHLLHGRQGLVQVPQVLLAVCVAHERLGVPRLPGQEATVDVHGVVRVAHPPCALRLCETLPCTAVEALLDGEEATESSASTTAWGVSGMPGACHGAAGRGGRGQRITSAPAGGGVAQRLRGVEGEGVALQAVLGLQLVQADLELRGPLVVGGVHLDEPVEAPRRLTPLALTLM
mmetsp:Transcript_5391/g.12699  ORF Transcript_5391/g.12699 Transcript_5391/m.12699 type:complete len:228 (+) Transcript_5391:1822-2505(+)